MNFSFPLPQGGTLLIPLAPAAFLCGFLEGLAIPFPGTWLLALIGGAARLAPLNMLTLSLAASAGYTAGALAPYALGLLIRRLGTPSFLPRLGLTEARLEQLRVWFHRYGEPAVAWSRPFWVGNLVSIPAGMVRMPLWRFVPFTFAGIWPWAFAVLWVGDEAGNLMEVLGTWTFWAVGAAAAAAAALTWYRHVRRRQRQAPEPAD